LHRLRVLVALAGPPAPKLVWRLQANTALQLPKVKSMSKDSLAAKGLLRHSSVTTTERPYIKDVPENTLAAMNQLEKLFNECSTVKN
jgi:hypothetical protein